MSVQRLTKIKINEGGQKYVFNITQIINRNKSSNNYSGTGKENIPKKKNNNYTTNHNIKQKKKISTNSFCDLINFNECRYFQFKGTYRNSVSPKFHGKYGKTKVQQYFCYLFRIYFFVFLFFFYFLKRHLAVILNPISTQLFIVALSGIPQNQKQKTANH